jgi:hypothetical protein
MSAALARGRRRARRYGALRMPRALDRELFRAGGYPVRVWQAGLFGAVAGYLAYKGFGSPSLASGRDPSTLNQAIDSLDVTNSAKYQPANGVTYCNIFVQDVMGLLGAPLTNADANDTVAWLNDSSNGWTETDDPQAAQNWANQGGPAIVGWSNPGGHGHVAVVRAGTLDPSRGPEISAAGASLIGDGWMTQSFGNNGPVQYFLHS